MATLTGSPLLSTGWLDEKDPTRENAPGAQESITCATGAVSQAGSCMLVTDLFGN
jgi:hypothetical protein